MSKIKNQITSSVEIVRVVNLKKGDVYRRLESNTYGGPSLSYGVVTNIVNNGETTVVTAMEYAKGYAALEPKARVFTGETDITIFPADPAELIDEMQEVLNAAASEIQRAEKALNDKRTAYAETVKVAEMLQAGTLTPPEVVVGEVTKALEEGEEERS